MNDKELRRLALAATEGPWSHEENEGWNSWNSVYGPAKHGVLAKVVGDRAEVVATAAYIAAANPQAMIELLDSKATVLCGDYELCRFDDNSIWLKNSDDEGMQISDENFAKLLDDYFRENF